MLDGCCNVEDDLYELTPAFPNGENGGGGGGSGGGGSGPSSHAPFPTECSADYSQQESDFNALLLDAEAFDQPEQPYMVEAAAGVQTKPWAGDWVCLKFSQSCRLRGHVSGEIKKIASSPDPLRTWAFKKIKYEGMQIEGWLFPGTTVSFTQGIATPSFTEDNAALYNYLSALMQVKFNVTYQFKPVGNCPIAADVIAVISVPISVPYVTRGAWALWDKY